MKRLKTFLAIAALLALSASCGPEKKAPRMLVLYYSQTSNTETVAQEIASRLGADMEEIVPVRPYDGDFEATIARCMQERDEGILPEIQPLEANLADYDVVFLGYPVWFGTFAPPVAAFLGQASLSGKKVVPFCTFGSGGLNTSVKDLAKKQPEAVILPGYGVRAARMDAVPAEVDQFLKANGFIEGEFAQLDPFPEQHEASEEEKAVFDAAVGDYPMIHAQAKSVAQRSIPGGTEYLFTAVPLTREGDPIPQADEMEVFVTVLEGEAPVFTQVNR